MKSSVYIHPKALVESEHIGENTRIWAFAQVMKGAVIGANCNICGFSFIESGATLGDNVKIKNGVSVWDKVSIDEDVFVGPNVVFTNDKYPRAFHTSDPNTWLATRVRRGATLGAGSVIVCGVEVGEYAFIAAAAVVTKDVPPHSLVVGHPGIIAGWTCKCLRTRVKIGDQTRQLSCSSCETVLSLPTR